MEHVGLCRFQDLGWLKGVTQEDRISDDARVELGWIFPSERSKGHLRSRFTKEPSATFGRCANVLPRHLFMLAFRQYYRLERAVS